MKRILKIEGATVIIGTEENKIIKLPIATVNYANPQVGDEVEIFTDEDTTIVARVQPSRQENFENVKEESRQENNQSTTYTVTRRVVTRTYNKHVFVWVGSFLFGCFGVDRFMRGQVGLGILKLLTCGVCGIWALVDFIIAVTKVYGEAFGQVEDVAFVDGDYAE